MEKKKKKIVYNAAQLVVALARKKIVSVEGGRGMGKSTIISNRLKNYNYQLPRAKIAIPGETYKQLLTRTLPSTIEGLEMHGFKKGEHYVVGGRPPKQWKWPESYQPPLDYETSIIFYTGFTAQMVSLDSDTGGRGINFDGVVADEGSTLNKLRLANNIFASNRGNIDRFRNHWLHHAILMVGSTGQTINSRWFSELADDAKAHPDKHLHIIANSYVNFKNLGPDWFKLMKQQMTTLQYNAEIMCIRPGQIENGFYPLFSEDRHTYDASNTNYLFGLEGDTERLKLDSCMSDSDMREIPIDIACDWGVRINTMVCGQPAELGNEYRFINSLHVLAPQTLHDLATKFCDYYESKVKKVVNFYYDHTAKVKDTSNLSFADHLTDRLRLRGWEVNRIDVGHAPLHRAKYLFWEIAMREDGTTRLPIFRYNKNNCKHLVVSVQQAGAIEGADGIQKDKRPEKKESQKQEEATHYSDAMDTLAYFKFRNRLTTSGYII